MQPAAPVAITLSIVNTNADAAPPAARPLDFRPRQEPPLIAYSVADWQQMREADQRPEPDHWLKYA